MKTREETDVETEKEAEKAVENCEIENKAEDETENRTENKAEDKAEDRTENKTRSETKSKIENKIESKTEKRGIRKYNNLKKWVVGFVFLFVILINGVITAQAKTPALSKTKVQLTVKQKYNLVVKNSKKSVVWSCSNHSVLSIRRKGARQIQITGMKKGTAVISAKIAGTQGPKLTCKITVKPAPHKLKIAIAKSTAGNINSIYSMVKKLGAIPVVVSSNCKVSSYDGLILPGGGDINPSRYKQKNKSCKGVSNYYDAQQFAILKKFADAKKPVFGICRGEQLINVYFGGTLKQNIGGHRGKKHKISISAGSWISKSCGKGLQVSSYHHQAVQKLGRDLKAVAWAPDKNIEAIEHETLPIYGVQWHPECGMGKDGSAEIKAFLSLCKDYRNK